MKIVLDTNVLVSALFFKGKPQKLLDLFTKKKFQLVYSQEILEEYLEVFEEFKPWSPVSGVHHFLALLSLRGIPVNAYRIKEKNVCRDPHDLKFLEAALAGKARHVVSGDKDLLVIKEFRNVQISTVNQVLNELGA